jgi:hypothetical protein
MINKNVSRENISTYTISQKITRVRNSEVNLTLGTLIFR